MRAPNAQEFPMTRSLTLTSLVCLVICCGCGDNREDLAAEQVSTMEEMVSVLQNIKDEASAKASKDKLAAVLKRMDDINQREAKLPQPTEAEVDAIDQKHGKRMEELMMKFAAEAMRIQFDPKIRAVLDDLDQQFQKIRS
jgi:hypothetical protein